MVFKGDCVVSNHENKMPESGIDKDDDFMRNRNDNSMIDETQQDNESQSETETGGANEDVTTRRQARVFQRSRTREVQTLDLINETNVQLRRILRVADVSKDVYSLILDIVFKKDKELIRLRRKSLRSQDALNAVYKNLRQRLISKAQQARYLQEAVNAMKNHRPKGKVAVSRFQTSDSNGS